MCLCIYISMTPSRYPTTALLVQAAYPTHCWDLDRFFSGGSLSNQHASSSSPSSLAPLPRGGGPSFTPQRLLARMVRSLFPNNTITPNARRAPGILGPKGSLLEVDIFLEELRLGFEFQVFSSLLYVVFFNFLIFFYKRINTIIFIPAMESTHYLSILSAHNCAITACHSLSRSFLFFFFVLFEMCRYRAHDQLKQAQAGVKGITLINVPFWWDWNIER